LNGNLISTGAELAREEKRRTDEAKDYANEEKRRADDEKRRADEEKRRADVEKRRADSALAQLERLKTKRAPKKRKSSK
jgi:hypothetical protein